MGIEEKAVREILKDTKRAAARAAVGGPQSWTKGNTGKDINKRFLNNTLLSTVYNNSKDKKVKVRGHLTREDKALFKAAEKLKSKEVPIDNSKVKEAKKLEEVPVRRGKVTPSSGSRLQAFLKAKQLKETAEKRKKEEKEKEEEKAKVETSVGSEKPQPYWRPVEGDSE